MPFFRFAWLIAVGLLASSAAHAADSMLDAETMYTFTSNLSRVLSRNWWDEYF
jgi:hypothetical protein